MRTSTTLRLAVWTLALVLGAGWWFVWRSDTPPDRVPTSSPRPRHAPDGTPIVVAAPVTRATLERPEWLRVVPPSVVLRTPGVSAQRGSDGTPFGVAFDQAISAWQAGSYAEAAARLEPVAAAHPDVAESHFYLGTAWLLAGLPQDAVAPLRRAVSLAPPSLRGEAAWYLGLALLGDTRTTEARRAFAEACEAGRARGCDAARHLGDPSPPGP